MAFGAGVLHGIAGPGGVLGVMVALKLNDWFKSCFYLLLFFIASIVTMALYAFIYSSITNKLTQISNNEEKCNFMLKVFSASLSIIVGILWLILIFTDTMEQVFD